MEVFYCASMWLMGAISMGMGILWRAYDVGYRYEVWHRDFSYKEHSNTEMAGSDCNR
jgi:hypothetical protein